MNKKIHWKKEKTINLLLSLKNKLIKKRKKRKKKHNNILLVSRPGTDNQQSNHYPFLSFSLLLFPQQLKNSKLHGIFNKLKLIIQKHFKYI